MNDNPNTTNLETQNQASGYAAIIDCPRCQAQFGLPSQLSNTSTNFHCSVCDYLFSGQALNSEEAILLAGDSIDPSTSVEPETAQLKTTGDSVDELEIQGLIDGLNTLTEAIDGDTATEMSDDKSTSTIEAESVEDENVATATEVNEAEYVQASETTPSIEATQGAKVTISDPIPSDTPTTKLSSEERGDFFEEQLDLGLEATLGASIEDSTLINEDDATTELPADALEQPEFEAQLTRLEREKIELSQEKLSPAGKSIVEQTTDQQTKEVFTDLTSSARSETRALSLGFLCLPIFLFLGALGGSAYFLSLKGNKTSIQIAQLLTQGAAQVAPAGLRIRNTNFKRIKLLNGEFVPVITGTLYNDTTRTFQSVLIEGVLFDSRGKTQQQLKVRAGSLPRSIKDYTLEMIQAQQTQTSGKRFELTPGSSQQFTVAMIGTPTRSASYYTARIYSVKS